MKRDKKLLILIWCCIMMMAGMGVSCENDDEEFVDNPALPVYFSQDTICFDTIFTSIGSATKEFTIHNPNDKAVRLPSVRLASNGASGFRVNLDGQFGTQFSDIEIFHKDSIFCFVEVTVDPHDSDTPILLEDSLIFTMPDGRIRKLFLQAYGQDIIKVNALEISSDTIIAPTRPMVIYDSICVKQGATLTISAGSTLCFHRGASLQVHGRLVCNGTLEKPIIFRGDRTDNLLPDLPYDLLDCQWDGIHIYPESHDNYLEYCDIHSGNYGIIADNAIDKNNPDNNAEDEEQKLTLLNTIIHNVGGDCLYLQRTKAEILNTQLSNARGYCANIIGGTTRFTHCTLAQFCPWTYGGSALFFANVDSTLIYPLNLIQFTNCIITGATSDEVYANRMQDSDAAFNYKFINSIVNTVISDDDAEQFPNCLFDRKKKGYTPKDEEEEKLVIRGDHFRCMTDYYYDFHLDSLSTARGLGDGALVPEQCRYDLSGELRPQENPDAGCYQYVMNKNEDKNEVNP